MRRAQHVSHRFFSSLGLTGGEEFSPLSSFLSSEATSWSAKTVRHVR